MADETMTTAERPEMACPKDGAAMVPASRRGQGNMFRCPTCGGVFLDLDAVRRGRSGRPPAWAPVVVSVLMSVGMTLLVRRLRRSR
jgi:hypothetical protein